MSRKTSLVFSLHLTPIQSESSLPMSESPLEIILPSITGVETARSSWRDILGVTASISCAIHCAVMPIAIGYLPAFATDFLADESFHQWMVLICLMLAIAAFIPGWRRHRRLLPSVVGVIGLSVIATAAFAVPDTCCSEGQASVGINTSGVEADCCTDSCCQEVDSSELATSGSGDTTSGPILQAGFGLFLTPFGGMLLVIGHLLNHRLSCQRDCCADIAECS